MRENGKRGGEREADYVVWNRAVNLFTGYMFKYIRISKHVVTRFNNSNMSFPSQNMLVQLPKAIFMYINN